MKTNRLTELSSHAGPFVSATVDVGRHTENAAHEQELRIRAACDALAEHDANADDIAALANRMGEQTGEPAPVARTVVVCHGEVVFDELLHMQLDTPSVWSGPLPDVAVWVAHEDARTPFVLAVVDHEGGNVAAYLTDGPLADHETAAGGETQYVHRVVSGGWSQPRYQHTSENVWRRNADAVADEIEAHVRAGICLVLLAGDPTSRGLVAARLTDPRIDLVQVESGERSEDGGDDALAKEVRDVLAEQAVARRVDAAHRFKDRLGSGHAAATGVRDVVAALVSRQVETLLIDPAACEGLQVTPVDHPGLVVGPDEVEQPVPAGQALIAAASLSGADVEVAPSRALGGSPVAALLRWDQSATAGG